MAKFSKQELAWGKIMETSTNPQGLMETALKLKMKPFTLEEAKKLAALNQEIISLHVDQAEPEKGFIELVLESVFTEDLTKKEEIYNKMVAQELRSMQRKALAEHEEARDSLSTQEETSGARSGKMPVAEIAKLTGLTVEAFTAIDTMPTDEFFAWIAKWDEGRESEPGHPSWGAFYAAEGRQEKEAILRKIFKGTLTPEEMEQFFPKDGD